MRRIKAGLYISLDGKARIRRDLPSQGGRWWVEAPKPRSPGWDRLVAYRTLAEATRVVEGRA